METAWWVSPQGGGQRVVVHMQWGERVDGWGAGDAVGVRRRLLHSVPR